MTLNQLQLNGEGPTSGTSSISIGTANNTWNLSGTPTISLNAAPDSGNLASFTINPNLQLPNQNLTVTGSGAGGLTISGNILNGSSGTSVILSASNSVVTLSGNNTFTGQLKVESGTLAVATWNSPGTAGVLGEGNSGTSGLTRFQLGASGQMATLEYTGASSITAGTIFNLSGGAVFQIDNAGTNVTLNGSNWCNNSGSVRT